MRSHFDAISQFVHDNDSEIATATVTMMTTAQRALAHTMNRPCFTFTKDNITVLFSWTMHFSWSFTFHLIRISELQPRKRHTHTHAFLNLQSQIADSFIRLNRKKNDAQFFRVQMKLKPTFRQNRKAWNNLDAELSRSPDALISSSTHRLFWAVNEKCSLNRVWTNLHRSEFEFECH